MIKNIVIGVLALIIVGLLFFRNQECKSSKIKVVTDNDTIIQTIVKSKDVIEEVYYDTTRNYYQEELDALVRSIDSLDALPKSEVDISKTGEEIVVKKSVEDIIVGFNDITKSKTAETVLKNFLPDFTTNVVNIGVDNKVQVERMTSKAYKKRLDDMLHIPGLKYEMEDPVHLKTFVRDNVAIALYMTEYDILMKGRETIKGFLLGQLTFKKYQNKEWKVGNYSVVNIRNVDLMDEVFSSNQ